jgi:hypothetical protein
MRESYSFLRRKEIRKERERRKVPSFLRKEIRKERAMEFHSIYSLHSHQTFHPARSSRRRSWVSIKEDEVMFADAGFGFSASSAAADDAIYASSDRYTHIHPYLVSCCLFLVPSLCPAEPII